MSEAAKILALDAAGGSCSAAIWAAGAIRARRGEVMARGQSERLVPMIVEVMAEAGLDYADLDAIAVTCGPGGFTGVRIGLATARGLALALGRPLVGIGNFEALAASVPEDPPAGHVIAAIDSKRAEVYVQAFSAPASDGVPAPAGPGRAVLPEELDRALPAGALLLVGDGAARAAAALRARGRECTLAPAPGPCIAALAARLAARLTDLGPEAAAARPPRPIYLRGPDVTLPDGRRIQAPGRSRARPQ